MNYLPNLTKKLKGLLLLCCIIFSLIAHAQGGDIARVERKTNAIGTNVNALTDSITDLNSRMDEQFLEIQRLQQTVEQDLNSIKSVVGLSLIHI